MRVIYMMTCYVAAAFMVGCTHMTPTYQESVDNVNKLQAAGKASVNVGNFTGKNELQRLSARANSFTSPYNDSFSEYIREALRLELVRAGILDTNSPVTIEGVLEANDLDIGVEVGLQNISVRFIVRRNPKVIYEKIITTQHRWGSAFIGAVAIPMARDAYPAAVSKLFSQLFSDPEFIAAIRGG